MVFVPKDRQDLSQGPTSFMHTWGNKGQGSESVVKTNEKWPEQEFDFQPSKREEGKTASLETGEREWS